ncbi:HAD family hydrolase [Carboxylicivirga marina]|uniref:HAD family hydrolase n=1 Tax=Carboxylicivirga marina TaxID=2800988 RepID=A0ABS1HDR7_9BACT|nr:HAD family hydrolase [Carboxylicivirga marina]MBK3515771.1 HAD family hydrolase [Carboxylicivirga marina]
MIKMIVSDMDGTLLNSNKQLPKDFIEVYQLMKAAKIQFVVASGRQYYTLVDEFAHFDHDIAYVAENGGFIHWGNNTQTMKPMKAGDAKEMIETLREQEGVNVVLCGQKGAYVEAGLSEEFNVELQKYYTKNQVVKNLLEVDDDILKIAVNDFKNLESSVYPLVKEKFDSDFQISTSSPIWFDVMPKGINKGEAIQLLQKELNILPEECMAFGDYLNDYEMLQSVYHSYAMDNAHPEIKSIARNVTASNDDNGVMEAIRQQLLHMAAK